MKGAAAPLEASALPAGRAPVVHAWRDRLLSSPRFQRFMARTPILRRFARHHAGALFSLCSGFIHSQVLYFSVRSGLLESLRSGALPVEELQRRCRLDAARARVLLQATDALGLTTARAPGIWGLGVLGAALVGNSAVLRMIEHQPLFYADLGDPLGLLQERRSAGCLAGFWAYAGQEQPEQAQAAATDGYTALMASTQSLVAEDVLAAYRFAGHSCLLDIGGGSGAFLVAVGRQVPHLRLMLLDLPAVAERGRQNLQAEGLASRAQVYGGSFLGRLPVGADVISLVRVLHDHDDPTVRLLLRAVRAALPPGGRVVIAEPMLAVAGSLPVAETYMGFYLLAMGQGRLRTAAELGGLLAEAGFGPARQHPTPRPWQCSVLSATAA